MALGARVLSLAQSNQQVDIKTRAAYFLRLCRATCMNWLLDIHRRQRIHSSSDRLNQGELEPHVQLTSLAIALACRQTFDVDSEIMFLVFNSERDLGLH